MKINTSTPRQHLENRGVESEMVVNSIVAEEINTSTPLTNLTHMRTHASLNAGAETGVEGVEVFNNSTQSRDSASKSRGAVNTSETMLEADSTPRHSKQDERSASAEPLSAVIDLAQQRANGGDCENLTSVRHSDPPPARYYRPGVLPNAGERGAFLSSALTPTSGRGGGSK
jgi:hypothetical protein